MERFRNLSAYLCNFEEYSQLPLSAQFELLSVPDGKWNERLTSISLICLCVAMIALLATLFQILLS
ncbi:MAG: hypothetical protein HDS83_02330 [Bacteroidales bacterium]|nr:hypothetical protein [Bacteroidales bacterium]